MTELQERATQAAQGYVFRDTGLLITRDLTRTEWTAVGAAIRGRTEGAHWALGDWLLYGGGRGRQWLGNSYAHAMRATGYGQPWLSVAYKVSESFPPDSRDPAVTWGVYRALHQLPRQRHADLLRTVKAKRWTAADLQAHLDAAHPRQFARQGGTPKRRSQRDHVTCPQCAHTFPIHGNRARKEPQP